ncbi:MAG: AgmX/PglI C-terminal domain-containing protein [Proteobacteria bacterium]|nr:MAG: AgmX/PglI C-terminal domain-containing protein [Pseudomonadota bacterium]
MISLKSTRFSSAIVMTILAVGFSPIHAAPGKRAGATEEPTSQGSLSKEEVQTVIRTNLKTVRACYEETLKKEPTAKGTLRVKFRIMVDGKVSEAKGETRDNLPLSLQDCVTAAMKLWVFPVARNKEATTVTYPFVFKPE